MRSIWIAAVVLLPPAAGCVNPAPESLEVAFAPVSCTIKGDATCEMGKAPKITVALTHQTEATIYLVGSLDASDCKWRYPYCYFEVTGPDGKSAVRAIGRCGNMNTLREKDFVKVTPGEAFDPYQHIDDFGFFQSHQLVPRNFQSAGEYRIRFVYSTKSNNIAAWGGDGCDKVAADERLVGLFGQVPKFEIRSNEIKINVVESGK